MARVEFVKRLHISTAEIPHQCFVAPAHRRIQTSFSCGPETVHIYLFTDVMPR